MAAAESRKRKQEEYEMQLFGFHSRAVYTTLKNIVLEGIRYKIEKLCKTLASSYELDNEKLKVLNANQKELEKAYYKGAMSQLKYIENVVNKHVAVPNSILLEEDKCQRVQYTESEFENIKQNLEGLQEKAKRATVFNAALKEELQILEQYPEFEENLCQMCKTIDNSLKFPDISEDTYDLVKSYKQFSTDIFNEMLITEKAKYNTIENVKYKDCDLNSL